MVITWHLFNIIATNPAKPLTFSIIEEAIDKIKTDHKYYILKIQVNSEGYWEIIKLVKRSKVKLIRINSMNFLGSIFGIPIYIDPHQKEPFKIFRKREPWE